MSLKTKQTRRVHFLGGTKVIPVTENERRITKGNYRYICTDFDAECDIYENKETGELFGLVSQ